jgi:GR25 family glycosyltransferase involved in LPS biosynthesis
MNAYVINLKFRTDRWGDVLNQTDALGLPLNRVIAVTLSEVPQSRFVTPPVHATWMSHQKAMRLFLDSDDQYGLILEDDFVLKKTWEKFDVEQYTSMGFDFLQVGYLITTPLDQIELRIKSNFDLLLKILQRVTSRGILSKSNFANRFLLREQRLVPFGLVCNDVRPGAHAYIVSREFALAAQELNLPVVLSTDALYMALGWMRSFKFLRTRRNYISQSNSETSISERFLIQ